LTAMLRPNEKSKYSGHRAPAGLGYALPELRAPERYRYRAAGVVIYDFNGPDKGLRVLLHRKHVVTNSDIRDDRDRRRRELESYIPPITNDGPTPRVVWNVLGGKRKVTDLCVEDTASREVWEETGGLVRHESLREELRKPQSAGVIWYPLGWYVLFMHRLGSAETNSMLKSHVHEVGDGDIPATFEAMKQALKDGSMTQAEFGIPDDGQETSELQWVTMIDLELGGPQWPHHVFLRGLLRNTQLLHRLRLEEEVHLGLEAGLKAAKAWRRRRRKRERAYASSAVPAQTKAPSRDREAAEARTTQNPPSSEDRRRVTSVSEAVNLALQASLAGEASVASESKMESGSGSDAESVIHDGDDGVDASQEKQTASHDDDDSVDMNDDGDDDVRFSLGSAVDEDAESMRYYCPACGVAAHDAKGFEEHLRGAQHERLVLIPGRLRYMVEGWLASDHRASALLKRTFESNGFLPLSSLQDNEIHPFTLHREQQLSAEDMVQYLMESPMLEVDAERLAVRAAFPFELVDRKTAARQGADIMVGKSTAGAYVTPPSAASGGTNPRALTKRQRRNRRHRGRGGGGSID